MLVIFSELMERTQSMDDSLYHEIELLPGMTVEQLQRRYEEIFGEPTGTKHKAHLIRRIAWRLQVLAQGDLPQRARQRALAMASDAELRTQVPARSGSAPNEPPFRATERRETAAFPSSALS
ncbi:MAG TPA: DUF2924 domain-containing protein [Candidatus Limnocylindrales bacterium]|nr:DUF2924 domain-containing protein [Candidatus Limnocylindrales bacterium]